MSEVKMGDVFNLPVYEQDGSVMCQGVIKHSQPHAELCMQAISYTGNDEKLAKHTVHAINNHDRLQQENAELREMLQKTATAIYSHNNEMVGMHAVMNCANESIKLLNKND